MVWPWSSQHRRGAAVAIPVRIEPLEGRVLLDAAFADSSAGRSQPQAAAPLAVNALAAAARPSVLSASPADGDRNVRRDIFIGIDLRLPNGPLNASTVTGSRVKLKKVGDGSTVSAKVNTSGGGDSIVLQPNSALEKNTDYIFSIDDDIEDIAGEPIIPFTMRFTTGTAGGPMDTGNIKFTKATLDAGLPEPWTAVEIGPDNKLYASTLDGRIVRWTIKSDGTLSGRQAFTPFGDNPRIVLGFAFDPASTSSNVVLWISNAEYKFTTDTNPWGSKITRVSGSTFSTDEDVVVGLPRSTYNHAINQPSFGPDGAIYVQIPGLTSQGALDNVWGFRGEEALSAALLRIDVSKITPGSPIDVRTTGGAEYDPNAGGAPVTLYATGFRNAYDMVWAKDGRLYLADNGSNAGGAAPGTPADYSGQRIEPIAPLNEGQSDYLYLVERGGYYGHPNPTRGEYVLDGGNPTSEIDQGEVRSYPVGTLPDANWRGAAFSFGAKNSVNGLIEYQTNAFGGLLKGALIGTRYSGGKDLVILTRRPDGSINNYLTGVSGLTGFTGALDLTEDTRNGNLYVIDHPTQTISLIKPIGPISPTTPPPPLPAEDSLTSQDVDARTPGSTSKPAGTSGAYDVSAGGINIFGTSDGFRFLHEQRSGDFDVKAKVESIISASPNAKAGLMARQSLEPGSKNVFAAVAAQNGHRLSFRSAPNGPTALLKDAAPSAINNWIRLKRAGKVFTSYRSADGQNWTKVNQVTMALPAEVYFGLAACSASDTALATAAFREVGDVIPATPPPVAQPAWSTGPALPVDLTEARGALIGSKIYVAAEGDSRTFILDTQSNTWTTGAARPFVGEPNDAEHAGETAGGKLYLFGGLDTESDNRVQIYDPATNTWSPGADQPFNAGSSNSAVINGEIYIAGGAVKYPSYAPVASAAKYSPAANTWTPLASMPLPRHAAASGTDGQKLYVFGGRDAGLEPSSGTNIVQIYDPITNTWKTSGQADGPAPIPRKLRGQTKAVFHNGEFYIFGGETSFTGEGATSDLVFKNVDIYNPLTNTWRRGADLPTARHAVLPILVGNRIYAIAGGTERGTSLSKVVEILTIP